MKKRNYTHLNVNPCKMCMPMGGSLAFKGIEKSMILIHGSQGCSTYIRRHIAAHYNEPVDIASSSLSEQGTVYGGEKNLILGLKNLIKLYNPSVIGVLTTCLAETIGEDIEGIITQFQKEYGYKNIKIVPVPTPGYHASQYEGYYFSLKKIIENVTKPSKPNNKINIIVSDMTPEDIRELKRIVNLFNIEAVYLPDISDTLDGEYKKNFSKILDEGTNIKDIKNMSGALATIEFGYLLKDNYSPGKYLLDTYNVPLYRLPIPIGLENTDCFIKTLKEITNYKIPKELEQEKGRMLDAMIDSHKFNAEGIAAIYGSPELVYSVSTLCIENGITPKVIVTGSRNDNLLKAIKPKLKRFNMHSNILDDSDFLTLQQLLKKENINILIGNSDGKFLKEKENINLVRIGFPIHDHIGAQRRLNIGYKGSVCFLDAITNTLLDNKHNNYKNHMYQTYYKKTNISS